MLDYFIKKIIGTKNDRDIKRLSAILQEVNQFEGALKNIPDGQLRSKTGYFKEQLSGGRRLTISSRRHLPWCGKLPKEPSG